MNLLGIQLQLMIGPTIAAPAPKMVAEALQSVEVTHADEGRSGFQMSFRIDRSGATGMLGETLLASPLFKVFNRVVLTVILKGVPRVLMDGIITHQQLQPGGDPGMSVLTLTGEDVSVMMDQDDASVEHPGQAENIIALKIIASYAQYGLIPLVIPPTFVDQPMGIDRTPIQADTDLEYLEEMAKRYGYVFYIIPGPVPLTNTAYWGPPIRVGVPQKALSVNMDPYSNVDSISFQHNALTPKTVSGNTQDPTTGQSLPVRTFVSLRLPLASLPDLMVNQPNIRNTQFRETGYNFMQANARAQAATDKSTDEVVTVTGELEAMRYGDLLQPRSLVGLRGAGLLYDGLYYVKQVKHIISRGSYRQSFTLTREGLGTTTPVVIV